jgi:hypothetical protein
LLVALVESEAILKDGQPVTKEFMAQELSKVFINMDLADFAKDLSQTKGRKKVVAPYLNSLARTFEEYIIRLKNQ